MLIYQGVFATSFQIGMSHCRARLKESSGTAQHFRARTTLKNYCNILEIVKDKAPLKPAP